VSRSECVAFASVLAMSAALIAAPWRGHVDDVDAQLYVVVARNMVADRTWFDLRYLPDLFPRYREHLPFGFWPAAAVLRWAGECAIGPLYGLFTLAPVAVAGAIAARLFGAAAGIAAALCLGTCESIWHYGGRLLLDPPLLLFATGAAAAVLVERPRWVVASVCTAMAVLVKGPFGLVPIASVVLARAVAERSGVVLVRGGVACAGALLPAAAFLAADGWLSQGTWWSGYVRDQILTSATGTRDDGVSAWWFPLRVAVGRFWPGLPLLAFAALAARRDRRAATICFSSAIALALLCVPPRKWGNHAYVAFPLLAIAAGAGGARVAASWIRRPANSRNLARMLAFGSVAAWCASLLGAGRLVLQPPCVRVGGVRAAARAVRAGDPGLGPASGGLGTHRRARRRAAARSCRPSNDSAGVDHLARRDAPSLAVPGRRAREGSPPPRARSVARARSSQPVGRVR
jgi:4-amino-4-deoxy-L-arabinose transferase-like glycosyltransferase